MAQFSSSLPSSTTNNGPCWQHPRHPLPYELLDELLICLPPELSRRHRLLSELLSTSSVVYNLLARNKSFRQWRRNELDKNDLGFELAGKNCFVPRVDSVRFQVPTEYFNIVEFSHKYVTVTGNKAQLSFILRIDHNLIPPGADVQATRARMLTYLEEKGAPEQSVRLMLNFSCEDWCIEQFPDFVVVKVAYDKINFEKRMAAIPKLLRAFEKLLEEAPSGQDLAALDAPVLTKFNTMLPIQIKWKNDGRLRRFDLKEHSFAALLCEMQKRVPTFGGTICYIDDQNDQIVVENDQDLMDMIDYFGQIGQDVVRIQTDHTNE